MKKFQTNWGKKNIFHTLQKNKLILGTLLTSSIMWFPSWLLTESSKLREELAIRGRHNANTKTRQWILLEKRPNQLK